MRYLKPAALLTLLALSLPASAASSNSTDFNSASLQVAANGSYAKAVNFSIPSTSITLDSSFIRPSSTFQVAIPVTNNTDRSIDIVVTPTITGEAASHLTLGGAGTATLAAGTNGTVNYTFTFDKDTASALAGQTVGVTFNVQATGTYNSDSGDTTF